MQGRPWITSRAKGHQRPGRQALTPLLKEPRGLLPPHGPIGLNNSLIEDFLEDILEPPIVGLKDGVLGTHVERPFLLDGVLEAAVGKARDGLQKAGRVLSGTCLRWGCRAPPLPPSQEGSAGQNPVSLGIPPGKAVPMPVLPCPLCPNRPSSSSPHPCCTCPGRHPRLGS